MCNKSELLFEEAKKYIPGGVNSPVRAFKAVGGTPPFIASALGSKIYDVDGKEYIDYVSSWGPMIVGHRHPQVIKALQKALTKGLSYGAPTEAEIELARMIVEAVPSIEMVRMVNSGTEATMSAIRLARGYAGRDKIIKFSGCYHGHGDFLLVKAGSGATTLGIPDSKGVPDDFARNTITLPFNNLDAVRKAVKAEASKIAAIIVEPVPGNMGVVLPQEGFLRGLRDLCHETGIVLIFDEVMSGFRVAWGGAQSLYGVIPDMTCLGKVIGGGLPVGAFGGKKEIMELGGLKHDKERVFLMSGTHGAENHGLAAALKTMKIYESEPVIETLWRQGERLAAKLRKSVDENHLTDYIPIMGRPCCLVYGTRDNEKKPSQPFRTLLIQETMERGILAPSLIVSYSHTDADIDKTVEAFHEAFRIYRKALDEGIEKYLIGRPVKPVWRKYN